MSTLDEPMQALMFFSKVDRPLLLRQIKLSPGRYLHDVADHYRSWNETCCIAQLS